MGPDNLERVWMIYNCTKCTKSCKTTFCAHFSQIWKLARFTLFIRKVFATKILLSGKFSLFATLCILCITVIYAYMPFLNVFMSLFLCIWMCILAANSIVSAATAPAVKPNSPSWWPNPSGHHRRNHVGKIHLLKTWL